MARGLCSHGTTMSRYQKPFGFSLFNSYPDDAYFDQCRAVVGITIGAPEWATEIRSAFSAPRNFSARVLASEADDA